MTGQPDDGEDTLFQTESGTGTTTSRFGAMGKSRSLYYTVSWTSSGCGQFLNATAIVDLLAPLRRIAS